MSDKNLTEHQQNFCARPNAKDNLTTWLSYLENLHTKSIDLGLLRVKQVAESLNLLKPAPKVITVGGTNGKGTTCRTLELILLEAGFKVGVYSSPHLIHYNERVRINGKELSDASHAQAFDWLETGRGATSLTYFEFGTLGALHLFKEANLDVVILEVGLGGRLDACNIIDADVAVITSIDIDHIDWLGDNREAIAIEKAGIFRPNQPAVIGEPNTPTSLIQVATELNSSLYEIGQVWHFTQNEHTWCWYGADLQLLDLPYPEVPVQNAATALATLYAGGFLNRADNQRIGLQHIKNALAKTALSGRFQIIKKQNFVHQEVSYTVPKLIVDVAHNPHAARYLKEQIDKLKRNLPSQVRFHFVIGMLADKDISNTFMALLPVVDSWHFISLDVPRGTDARTLSDILRAIPATETGESLTNLQITCHDSIAHALAFLDNNTAQEDIILVCGSFYTVAELLKLPINVANPD